VLDTHCHLTSEHFAEQFAGVLRAAQNAGVHGMISVATDAASAQAALNLAHTFDHIWCTSGIHPSEAAKKHDLSAIEAVAKDAKCLAWGELGLDEHWPDPPAAQQITLLESQLDMIKAWDTAGGRCLPIVIHCRKALDALLGRLEDSGLPGNRFIFHCFTDGPDEADRVLEFGAAISFTGVVTYPSAATVAQASDRVPIDRLMIETDAPYLSPVPVRGVRPNQPAHLPHTAAFLASRRGLDCSAFTDIMDDNAHRIYGVPR
jgi:TatD DNase family protein